MSNKNKTISRYAWFVSLLFAVGIFVPGWLGIDGMNGGYALSVFSGFFMITAIITAIMFGALGKQQDNILSGSKLLARWSYTPDEWQAFTGDEIVRDAQGKKMLFLIVAFWAVLFGIAFPIYDHENGIYVSYMMIGLVMLIGFVAFLSIRITRRNLLRPAADTYINTKGALVAGQMHSWAAPLGSLAGALLVTDDPPYIEITYYGGKTEYTVRIPIPTGKDEEAQHVVEALHASLT